MQNECVEQITPALDASLFESYPSNDVHSVQHSIFVYDNFSIIEFNQTLS